MKILITGGHLTPALALIDYALTQPEPPEIVFAGIKFTQKKTSQLSQEKLEITQRKIKFIKFSAVKLPELLSIWAVVKVFELIKSCLAAGIILIKEKPQVVVSFGGYVAIPFAIAGFVLRIPILTHEQTRVAGFANKIISRFARKVAVSYAPTTKYFPAHKTIVTGNPIRPTLFTTQPPTPTWLTPTTLQKPLLYITGGNQGSEIINTMIAKTINHLTNSWTVIHQCGTSGTKQNYYQTLTQAKTKLSPRKRSQYLIREWLTEPELAWIYQHATGAVSRAGANTVQELMSFALPSILIPLPFSYQNEQTLNAQAYAKTGAGILLKQKDLTPLALEKATDHLFRNRRSLKQKALKTAHKLDPHHTADHLYQVILSLVA